MKNWLYAVGLGVAVASASMSVQAASEAKIASMDVGAVFQQASQREGIAKKLESEFKSRATELQGMERDIQSGIARLQKNGASMSAADRTKLEKDLSAKRDTFMRKAQAFEQDNRRRQMEERNKMLNRIQTAATKVAKDKGYDMVVDSNAIIYAKSKTVADDVTSQVQSQVK